MYYFSLYSLFYNKHIHICATFLNLSHSMFVINLFIYLYIELRERVDKKHKNITNGAVITNTIYINKFLTSHLFFKRLHMLKVEL